ncbi:flagella cluster protein [Salinirubellus salinus]|uniref:Flagella cluster protein n=1 Tax=Salinirubellus salinus TaxID=1364945 RepID=A0A9E7UCQ4_9EURY|nr:flagella cluster protein [Salinirubellus salinus]UWM56119.1 flagella cluster protein [Salinirubellus salinus]
MTLFDVHDHRHRLKLLKDAGHTTVVEDRDGVPCPVCGDPFRRALLTERPGRSFDGVDGGFCVGRDADRLYVFTHP